MQNYAIWCYYLVRGGKMNFKPIFDRVVVLPEPSESVSASGIVLPETSMERPQFGKVVAVGDGENFDNEKVEMKVKVGQRVLFNKYAGAELKLDGKSYVVLRQIDIIGVMKND